MNITNSPDISVLLVKVSWDLSGVTPTILLTNLSEGNNLAAVSYAFTASSPTTTYIHEGNIDDPDETGIWSESVLSDAWPRPFGNIEWGIYTFFVTAKDSEGNIFTTELTPQTVNICRPNGNLPDSQNPYGLGTVLVQTKCDQARIYFQDNTNTSYRGITGSVGSSVLRVNFPMDNTGTVPSPFQINYFSTAMVPITYSGKGYQFLYTSIYDYDFGNEVHVRIKYLLNDTFGVWCNINLMPLICEYQKLIDSIQSGSCVDAEAANRKLMLINPKFSLVVIGIFQPLTGIDVPEVIEEIKEIGGWDCDCCNAAAGIIPTGSSAFEGYIFSVVPTCGDVGGEFVVNGYNIQLQLNDISYVFEICDGSPTQTTAFEVRQATNGCTKTYCLYVDVAQLAEDLLTTISTNAGLVNLFNSIVTSSAGGSGTLVVDGKCIFSSGISCNVVYTLPTIPVNTTFAVLTALKISSQPASIPLNFSFNLTNLPALQTYLNGLGYGTFAVTNPSGQTVVITSLNNTFGLGALAYTRAGSNFIASLETDCTGYSPISANQVVQNIIDYLCSLDDSQVVTSAEYEICYIDEDGVKQIETVDSGESLATLLAALTERGCTTIDYIVSLSATNCAAVKALFPQVTTEIMQANDTFLATKNGLCAGVYPTEAFLTMLTYGAYSPEVLAAFCNLVNLCNAGVPCSPYNIFYATLIPGSPGQADIVVTFENSDAITHTIRYARIDNTVSPVFIVATAGELVVTSPYTIPDVDYGQYRIGITPVYADGRVCPETFYDTNPCIGIMAFNAVYTNPNIVVTGTFEEVIESAKVTLAYPNGGSFSQIYPVSGGLLNQNITPPVGVFGTFFAYVQAVCNEDSGWLSNPSGQAAFEIEEASP